MVSFAGSLAAVLVVCGWHPYPSLREHVCLTADAPVKTTGHGVFLATIPWQRSSHSTSTLSNLVRSRGKGGVRTDHLPGGQTRRSTCLLPVHGWPAHRICPMQTILKLNLWAIPPIESLVLFFPSSATSLFCKLKPSQRLPRLSSSACLEPQPCSGSEHSEPAARRSRRAADFAAFAR
jgi:hypothetical protein